MGGIASEWTYPYSSFSGKNFDCTFNPRTTPPAAAFASFVNIEENSYDGLIEALVTYENFGGSESLMKFIDITKRFVVATEKQPDRLIEFYSHWEKHCLLDKPHNNLEGLERAVIVQRVHDWLGGLK